VVVGLLGEGPAEVSLRSPPPLGRPLAVERAGDGVYLRDGEMLVAEGRPAEIELEPPEAVDVEEAGEASRAGLERWSARHPYPTCVVCGPERDPEDCFGVFPGELPRSPGRFAALWSPDASLAEGGEVRPECVWAALDCPTIAPVVSFGDGPASVLAKLAVRREDAVEPDRPYVIVSWPLAVEGRKRQAGAALFADDGRPVALARALWIELRA
jgi:hypothetical protein